LLADYLAAHLLVKETKPPSEGKLERKYFQNKCNRFVPKKKLFQNAINFSGVTMMLS
jgi:hypothetical protein